MKKVFISYRRDDTEYAADRIKRALESGGGFEVIVDRDSLRGGQRYREALQQWIAQCEVLLALIGPHWLSMKEPQTGQRRIDDPDDFVRMEIREGLKLNKVIPVTVSRALLPRKEDLPDDLKDLPGRQAEAIDIKTFDADMQRLIRGINLFDIKVYDPGQWPIVPETVSIPRGRFLMGSPDDEAQRSQDEGPQHPVVFLEPFEIGRYAVTRGQFAAFAAARNYRIRVGAKVWDGSRWEHTANASWMRPGFEQDDTHPVVCVNSEDIDAYIKWLNEEADPGKNYRLPTEAEWEYACRAGTETPFWWGTSISPVQANYRGKSVYKGGGVKGEYRQKTVPVNTFPPNSWGLYQMHGNVWERCADVWNENCYKEKGSDTSARASTRGDPERRVLRGGSWQSNPDQLRSANRTSGSLKDRLSERGFRIARTL
jgi:formylglycine-generating enzyme required for sulfatase activity